MEEQRQSLDLIRAAVNRLRVAGKDDCYTVVAINNELDKLEASLNHE